MLLMQQQQNHAYAAFKAALQKSVADLKHDKLCAVFADTESFCMCVAPEIAKECQKSHLRQLASHCKEYIYILYTDQVSDGRRLKSKSAE